MDAATDWSPVVIFDLESSGTPGGGEIIQLAACANSHRTYMAFVFPERGVSEYVQKLTGFATEGDSLTLRGQRVDCVSRDAAVHGFLDYLSEVRGARADQLVLVAHHAFGTDANHLISMVAAEGHLARMAELVRGFSDTLPLFREALPDRVAHAKKGDFTLGTLARDFEVLAGVGDLHSADQDAIVLNRLLKKIGISQKKIVDAAKPLDTFSAYKNALTNEAQVGTLLSAALESTKLLPAGAEDKESDECIVKELQSKLPVVKTLEKAAKKVKEKLPKMVEDAGWTTNFHVGQVEHKKDSLSSAREELEDDPSLATARKYADDAVAEAEHMPDWLLLIEDNSASWMMELKRGSDVWSGSFRIGMYAEAGHPALYALLDDGVLKKQNTCQKVDSTEGRIKLMKKLEKAASSVKDRLEQLFLYLEFYRNKHEVDLLEGEAFQLTATKEQVEEVLKVSKKEMLRDTKELVADALLRFQYLVDWLYLTSSEETTVCMVVRRGADEWTGQQSMKDFPDCAQVLLFDVMRGDEIKRQ